MASILTKCDPDKLFEDNYPDIDLLKEDFHTVFVDSGTMGDENGFIIKLSILTRAPRDGWVEERVYYPYTPLRSEVGEEPLPYFVAPGIDSPKKRQALSYLIEVASLLAIAKNPSLVFGDDKVKKLYLVRHGPLLQLLILYISKVYSVKVDIIKGALSYAGLDEDSIEKIIGDVEEEDELTIGEVILKILNEMAKISSKNTVFAGVVENVSESRVLLARTWAKVAKELINKSESSCTADVRDLCYEDVAEKLYDEVSLNKDVFRKCLCLDLSEIGKAGFIVSWSHFLKVLRERYLDMFGTHMGNYVGEDEIEMIILKDKLSSVNITDEDVFYSLYFISNEEKKPVTKPLGGMARAMLFGLDLQSSSIVRRKLKYRYFAPLPPDLPLKCKALEALNLSVEPCKLSGELIKVPAPIRVEYLTTEDNDIPELLSLLYYSSLTVLYSFPPQLLLVDKFSRVSVSDMLTVTPLLQEMAKRVRPFKIFIHEWSNRKELM